MKAAGLIGVGLALGLMGSAAQARCAGGESEIFSCKIAGSSKRVEICEGGQVTRYAFGRPGRAPELDLSVPTAALEYTPWNGVGRTIYEEVTFRNAGHGYTIFFLFDRFAEVPQDALSAGITVTRGGRELANLECDPATVGNGLDALFERKQAVGQCWDYAEFRWSANCPSN